MQRVFPQLNTANASKSVSKIFYKLTERRKLKNLDGPEGRLRKIQKTLTALIKYERIEVNYQRGDEVRGYAEQVSIWFIIIEFFNCLHVKMEN